MKITDESKLREMARAAMEAGKLPHRRPRRMWGGPGGGAPCAVCSRPVAQNELGFELEFGLEDEATAEGEWHVHLQCFAAWEAERRHSDTVPAAVHEKRSPPTEHLDAGKCDIAGQLHAQALPAASNDGTICANDDATVSATERDTAYRGGGTAQ